VSAPESARQPSTFEDWLAINALLVTYTELVDLGRDEDVAALFEHSSYRIDHADSTELSEFFGSSEVFEFCRQTIRHADGTPRTKHTLGNVTIELDGDQATARSYVTVFQQTETLPLQPIASGRYIDRFSRVDGTWRFSDRLICSFLLGDRSQHVLWPDGTPETEC
jgi:SnoaL-like domain